MADVLTGRSPLGSEINALRTHGDPVVVALRELPASTMVDLRLDPANAAALDFVQSALGLILPLMPGKSSDGKERTALWFGPDQWLIIAPGAAAAPLVEALQHEAVAAVDVSDLRAEFELCGSLAADVLRKGCAIDLHPREFRPGDCVLTMLARMRVALHQTDERPGYRIFVERSVAAYLWSWLVDAMMEFGGE